MQTVQISLSPKGLRELRRILRRMGASRSFSGWAICDLLIIRPAHVEIELPKGQAIRVNLVEDSVRWIP